MTDHPVTKLDLELFHAGELESKAAQSIAAHTAQCAQCREFIDGLESRRREFLNRYPFSGLSPAQPTTRRPWFRELISALTRPTLIPVYAAALVLMVVIPGYLGGTKQYSPQIRYKGTGGLSFAVRRNGAVVPGSVSDLFRAGDEIQILFDASAPQHLAVVSIDSRGVVSFYHPDENSRFCSIRIKSGLAQSFPSSIILDDTPGPELIIALFADRPLGADEVQKRLQALHSEADSPAALEQQLVSARIVGVRAIQTLLLTKEPA